MQKVDLALEKAAKTKCLMLAHAKLTSFPLTKMLRKGEFERLIRLDLSYNYLTHLPSEILQLQSLNELWLQQNPLTTLDGISGLQQLEVLDIRNTQVASFPSEIATLKRLYELDWRETPVGNTLWIENEIEVNDLPALMTILHEQYTREQLESVLLESLSGVKYMKEADIPGMKDMIKNLVVTLSDMYSNIDEFSLFVRRADSLLPDKMKECTPTNLLRVKENFEEMQRQTTRKRLAADVEIKLRAIYYDRAERKEIDDMIEGIYKCVLSLEDIQHLVKYAIDIMPHEPTNVTGKGVWSSLLEHQDELTAKREQAIATLTTSMMGLYPEQKPSDISIKAREVAAVFAVERFATKKELERLTQVSAEAAKLFPAVYVSIIPEDIKEAAKIMFKAK